MESFIYGWLAKHQVIGTDAYHVVASFDPKETVEPCALEQGDALFQYVRNVSSEEPFTQTGRFFCLPGATRDGLGIFDGLAGRRLLRYVVIHPFTAIEGTSRDRAEVEREAKDRGYKDVQATDWKKSLGGSGGQTQIFVPYFLLGHVRCEGTADQPPNRSRR